MTDGKNREREGGRERDKRGRERETREGMMRRKFKRMCV